MFHSRFFYNLKIFWILLKIICKYPDFRFIQILWFLHIIDNKDLSLFYEESYKTYFKIKKSLKPKKCKH